MTASKLADLLRPHVADLKKDATAGSENATKVITIYQRLRRGVGSWIDPAICEMYFESWKKNK